MTDRASQLGVYPLGLRLDGRLVLVVGGGAVAQRRVPAMLAAGAQVRLVAPRITVGLDDLASAGRLEWIRREYQESDLDGAWLAMVATDSAEVNARVAANAEARRIWCVRSDDAQSSTAWTPAVGRHDGVTVAVLGGGDPRRASAVRDSVLDGLAAGSLPAPRFRERREDAVPGVALVGAGPGDPELITVRGRRLLARADVVVVDRLAPQVLLDELAPHVEVVDASKIPYGRSVSQQAINDVLVSRALAGKFVVRLKGGDPYVFGRGGEEVQACVEAGLPVEVVPGVTSAIAAPASAGIPVTHRGVTHEFVVVSGHVAPDDERSLVNWPALAQLRGTLVLLMATDKLPDIVATLIAHGRGPDTPAAAVHAGTTSQQQSVRATLSTIVETMAAQRLGHPATVVIGDVVSVLPLYT